MQRHVVDIGVGGKLVRVNAVIAAALGLRAHLVALARKALVADADQVIRVDRLGKRGHCVHPVANLFRHRVLVVLGIVEHALIARAKPIAGSLQDTDA